MKKSKNQEHPLKKKKELKKTPILKPNNKIANKKRKMKKKLFQMKNPRNK